MFEALRNIANDSRLACPLCGADCHLEFEFQFALAVGNYRYRVLAAFVPERSVSWNTSVGDDVVFWPFLVILNNPSEGNSVWLPYWHEVKSPSGAVHNRYGQWAPFMNQASFASLLAQARAKGYSV